MSITKLLGLDKIAKLGQIIKDNGGLKNSLYHLYRTDDLKSGKLIGEDKYGNKYYQNDQYFYGRNRWIIYNPKHGVDYDASMVPAEWFGWLHYKTDKPPTEKAPVKYSWMPDHTPNTSGSSAGAGTLMGSSNAYMPYTTTKPKIESWVPPKN
eukprot:TRINITY_DN24586_c0_g1_i1.p1 TRINITY_DN24586_c0_g1~~TRINITY_DN24586_c0_g1_i1.p1  ORF type:complete len:152 (-),score=36.34 TRINITY_DN24586_c0_g1_i1:83-538(-)